MSLCELRGSTGRSSARDLVRMFEQLGVSGSLLLEQTGGALFLTFTAGKLSTTFKLGDYQNLDAAEQRFSFEEHEAADLALVSSRFPGSNLSLFRALPSLSEQTLDPSYSDFKHVLETLAQQTFSGYLAFEVEARRGLILFLGGQMGTALFETDSYVQERSDALRAIYRHCLSDRPKALQLRELHPEMLSALLGLAHERLERSPNLATFSGLHVSEGGYTFWSAGKAFLRVATELRGRSGYYRPFENFQPLELPDDPPGWEKQRYHLTLRGSDALNPMTELAMAFKQGHGESGLQVLERFAQKATIEDAALHLKLGLDELKPWLETLEREGLIRRSDA